MRSFPSLATTCLLGLLLAAPAARADEHPTPEQRAHIEAVLRQMGFVSWGEIEREDGGRTWEVEDARLPDGTQYELKLAAEDLREIKRERED